jgi:hypothetical protein
MAIDQAFSPLPERASSSTQQHAYSYGPRIVAIETIVPHDVMPGLLAVRITAKSSDGSTYQGMGETYYIPTAASAVIHDFFSPIF